MLTFLAHVSSQTCAANASAELGPGGGDYAELTSLGRRGWPYIQLISYIRRSTGTSFSLCATCGQSTRPAKQSQSHPVFGVSDLRIHMHTHLAFGFESAQVSCASFTLPAFRGDGHLFGNHHLVCVCFPHLCLVVRPASTCSLFCCCS